MWVRSNWRREDRQISLLEVSETTGRPLRKNDVSPLLWLAVFWLLQASCVTEGTSVLEKLLVWHTSVMRRRNVVWPAPILLYNTTVCKQEQGLNWQGTNMKAFQLIALLMCWCFYESSLVGRCWHIFCLIR